MPRNGIGHSIVIVNIIFVARPCKWTQTTRLSVGYLQMILFRIMLVIKVESNTITNVFVKLWEFLVGHWRCQILILATGSLVLLLSGSQTFSQESLHMTIVIKKLDVIYIFLLSIRTRVNMVSWQMCTVFFSVVFFSMWTFTEKLLIDNYPKASVKSVFSEILKVNLFPQCCRPQRPGVCHTVCHQQ